MTRVLKSGLLLLCVATILLLPERGQPAEGRFVLLSLPAVQMAAKERVVGFMFELKAGRVAQMRDVPIGWNVTIQNDPSWNTSVDGSVIVAAAALDADFFRNFAIVEKQLYPGTSFEAKGEVVVSADFSSTRKIPIEMKDFAIKPNRNVLTAGPWDK